MKITVYCSSSDNIAPLYKNAAEEFGIAVASCGWTLVCGGMDCGLMKIAAASAKKQGGRTMGIVPRCILEKSPAYKDLDESVVTEDMKERKLRLRTEADAFAVLPGGWGTLEEITEVITLKQLGIHNKPVVFINTENFFRLFFDFITRAKREGFIDRKYDELYRIVETPFEAVEYVKTYVLRERVLKY